MIRPCPKCSRPTESDHNSFWCAYCKMLWPIHDSTGPPDDTIDRLSRLHPLTCGGNRGDECHRRYQETHGGDLGELTHDGQGLVCPACGWRQPPFVGHQLAASQKRIVELKALCGEAADELQGRYADFDFDAWAKSWGKGRRHPAESLLQRLREARNETS